MRVALVAGAALGAWLAGRALKRSRPEPGDRSLACAIILEAYRSGASTIHVEPTEDGGRVRFRIEDVLEERRRLSFDDFRAVGRALADMAGWSEPYPRACARIELQKWAKRAPELTLEASTWPVDPHSPYTPRAGGEKVAWTLLLTATYSITLPLADLGFASANVERIREALRARTGLVLVSGTTGSGGGTTAYGAAEEVVRAGGRSVVLEGAGWTRHVRTLDADVVVVPSIHDRDEAHAVVQLASERLVVAHVLADGALAGLLYLVALGVSPFLLAQTVTLAIGQRLARRRAREGTGYKGRLALHELATPDPALRRAIAEGAPVDLAALFSRAQTLREDGLAKMQAGLTDLEELDRVAPS